MLVLIFTIIISATGLLVAASVTKPHTFSSGEVISAEEVNENFDVLYQKVNELAENIQAAPVGSITAFAGPSDRVPAGWLICDGRLLESTDEEYQALYQVIGTYWGSSGTRFRLPDLRGEFLRGVDNGRGLDPDVENRRNYDGVVVGDIVGSFQDDAFESHNHLHNYSYERLMTPGTHDIGGGDFFIDKLAKYTGNSGGLETRPVNAGVNYIIKY
jgi:hypothetical protein